MSTMRITTAAALAVVFAVATASAQQPATQRVAGTLDKVEGNTLYIKAASGPVILKLADNALIVARIKASAASALLLMCLLAVGTNAYLTSTRSTAGLRTL